MALWSSCDLRLLECKPHGCGDACSQGWSCQTCLPHFCSVTNIRCPKTTYHGAFFFTWAQTCPYGYPLQIDLVGLFMGSGPQSHIWSIWCQMYFIYLFLFFRCILASRHFGVLERWYVAYALYNVVLATWPGATVYNGRWKFRPGGIKTTNGLMSLQARACCYMSLHQISKGFFLFVCF